MSDGMHVYLRKENLHGCDAYGVWIGCTQPILVWAPTPGQTGFPSDSHMLDFRALAEAAADLVVTQLRAKGYEVCRCNGQTCPTMIEAR